jgi:predicted glycoside hydrolase/deacetylase ChbG (UPF0249 family)
MVNADDWGRDAVTTNRIRDCAARGAVSSVSAMVFMEDSERAAESAREHGIEAGIHLNFTTRFSARGCSRVLMEHQARVSRHLLRHRLAPMVFHPALVRSFEYLTAAQIEEFARLYGGDPPKIDGHHHMHLCTNVLCQQLLPQGTLVRRHFSFEAGDKSVWNRAYRRCIDWRLSSHHKVVDYFFSIAPIEPRRRLTKVFSLAVDSVVELETHPVQEDEYRFLTEGELFEHIGNARIVRPSVITGGCGQ